MIFIRADANKEIAIGHIMRCVAIANALRNMDKEVVFITADEFGKNLVEKQDFACIVLDSDYKNMESEIDKLIFIIKHNDTEMLLVDSYLLTERYMRALHRETKTIWIDDENGMSVDCSILINYNLIVDTSYYNCYDDSVKLLLGPKYTPLREEFENVDNKIINERVSNILVLVGGADNYHVIYNICTSLIKVLDLLPECRVNIVCGKYNEDYSMISNLIKMSNRISLYRHIVDIWNYMQNADVCLSACGTSTKELAACGTPCVVYSMSDNQVINGDNLDMLGLMKYVGDVRAKNFNYDKMIKELMVLCGDVVRRERESRSLQRTIDGMGAVRIARELLK